jgi:hypothetical protein
MDENSNAQCRSKPLKSSSLGHRTGGLRCLGGSRYAHLPDDLVGVTGVTRYQRLPIMERDPRLGGLACF